MVAPGRARGVGGAVYETMHDGTRAAWGEILEYTDGRKIAMTWYPGNNANNATRVDVAFEALSDDLTRVTLTHSGWEIWGDAAQHKRENYNSGWDIVFGTHFAQAVAA